MFEIEIVQATPKGPLRKVWESEILCLWVNRYPDGHELAGHIKDLRVSRVEKGKNMAYPFVTLRVKVKE